MNFSNTYTSLDEVFYKESLPAITQNPQLFLWNSRLAEQLMVPNELKRDPIALAQVFSGNRILPGSEPIATAYAGHQFGNFVPQLGDGRAHLLGEVVDQSGQRLDIQLKGSGTTFFSRGGDGRCAIGPAVREFIMSEAMYALGVPTTGCLSVVTTGEQVFRETPSPGAVVTRIASSHIRIGTFQFFAARNDHQALKTLCDYTIERHYPDIQQEGPNQYIALINQFIDKQIQLIVEWMRVGFIHGVMNTDNTTLSGETIDYGPCAMMGTYDPKTVYSSIDTMGRYAFGNQPEITQWNIARFAECLLPLINSDIDAAIEQVEPMIKAFPDRFNQAYMTMMARKFGLTSFHKDDQTLILSILEQLKEKKMDYTITFNSLTNALVSEVAAAEMENKLDNDFGHWQKRLNEQPETSIEVHKLMRQQNPIVIPRNHHIEAILQECKQTGTATMADKFLRVLRSPYEEIKGTLQYQDTPADGDKNYQTFCGT